MLEFLRGLGREATLKRSADEGYTSHRKFGILTLSISPTLIAEFL